MTAYVERAALLGAFWWIAFGVIHGDWLGYWNPAVAIPIGLVLAFIEFDLGRRIVRRLQRRS
jgi:hypothetical protein